mgnify:CR=1 FL=1
MLLIPILPNVATVREYDAYDFKIASISYPTKAAPDSYITVNVTIWHRVGVRYGDDVFLEPRIYDLDKGELIAYQTFRILSFNNEGPLDFVFNLVTPNTYGLWRLSVRAYYFTTGQELSHDLGGWYRDIKIDIDPNVGSSAASTTTTTVYASHSTTITVTETQKVAVHKTETRTTVVRLYAPSKGGVETILLMVVILIACLFLSALLLVRSFPSGGSATASVAVLFNVRRVAYASIMS